MSEEVNGILGFCDTSDEGSGVWEYLTNIGHVRI